MKTITNLKEKLLKKAIDFECTLIGLTQKELCALYEVISNRKDKDSRLAIVLMLSSIEDKLFDLNEKAFMLWDESELKLPTQFFVA